jgi:hypothetical protein
MSGNSTNRPGNDPLDRALASLPRDVAPSRDLWADIRADIEATPPAAMPAPVAAPSHRWMRLAAGFLLVIASSVTTYVITQRSAEEKIAQTQRQIEEQLRKAPPVDVMPASFGQDVLGAEYQRARTALDAEFQRQVATLPPVTRAKLERNLADLRRAASDISATLAEHPNHPLLQELLLSTYQNELALLASVSHVSVPTLNQPETRL